ncbi:hypothetical protein EG329_007256 [Mollisiaceae sp. DMI_Dod_QoI]|nr:hypothetical protein EG329_007256 [Helotiales sp. DMI_Dod_QoI]
MEESVSAKTKRALTLLPFHLQAHCRSITYYCYNIIEPSIKKAKGETREQAKKRIEERNTEEIRKLKERLQEDLDAMDEPLEASSDLWQLLEIDRNRILALHKAGIKCFRDNLEVINERFYDLRIPPPLFTAPSGRQVSLDQVQMILGGHKDTSAPDQNDKKKDEEYEKKKKRSAEKYLKRCNDGYLLYRPGEREELLKGS